MNCGCSWLGGILGASSGWSGLPSLESFEEKGEIKACNFPPVRVVVISDLVGY